MKPLKLQSETYNPTGNLAGRGVLNQLGRPDIDTLTLALRESVQNSWDARATKKTTVDFTAAIRELTQSQTSILRGIVFPNAPFKSSLADKLNSVQTINSLTFSDRGTTGLGGPTRADRPTRSGERQDFVGFLRNVGQDPKKAMGGGTFGYGKSSFYLLSRVNTICVYTRCKVRGRFERRFMAAALGDSYDLLTTQGGQSPGVYTGRHWWGEHRGGIVEPVLDDDAAYIANSLGMPDFREDECGTTLLILDPDFGERSPSQAARFLAASIAWNFWPKMIPDSQNQLPMRFQTLLDDSDIPVPDPETTLPLNEFVTALRSVEGGNQPSLQHLFSPSQWSIDAFRPKKHLGSLSVVRHLDFGEPLTEGFAPGAPLEGRCHHIALLRSPRLVVRYLAGPELAVEGGGYAGVFVADDAVDSVFAESEPPAHEDWVDKHLSNPHHKTFVRVAKRRIQESLQEFLATESPDPEPQAQPQLAAFAEALGGIVPGLHGPSATVPKPGRSSRNRGGRRSAVTRASVSGAPSVTLRDGNPVLKFPITVEACEASRTFEIIAIPYVLLDNGGTEKEPPLGAAHPTVLGWERVDGEEFFIGDRLKASPSPEPIAFYLYTAAVPNTAVGIKFEVIQ